MVQETVFRIAGLRKSFGRVHVLVGVDLELRAGAVTVLMGANGAGKSTLVRIVSGVYDHDGGSMSLAGEAYAPVTPAEAMRAGVVTVHQNINDGVVADLDVATNLTLDRLNGRGARLIFNPRRVKREAQGVAERMGLSLDLSANINDLSLADRQMVAIARAMAHEPKVLILDEPTSSLSSAEAERLFQLVERLWARGVAILYISHRMHGIAELADECTVFRNGQKVASYDAGSKTDNEVIEMMIGREYHNVFPPKPERSATAVMTSGRRRPRALTSSPIASGTARMANWPTSSTACRTFRGMGALPTFNASEMNSTHSGGASSVRFRSTGMSSAWPPYLQAITVVTVHTSSACPMSKATSCEKAAAPRLNAANG